MGEATNIYPIYEKMMTRSDKEQLLGQRGVMVLFTAFWMVIIFVAVSIRI